MAQNEFHALEHIPDEKELQKLVPNLCYVRINTDALPEVIRSNGLAQKCNSFLIAASGSNNDICYTAIGLRPDKNNTVIDEHPFVFYYNGKDTTKNFCGIINHGNWDQRTVPLEQAQIDALSACGLTASFTYKTIPDSASGQLSDLSKNGMLVGISKQFDVLLSHVDHSEEQNS